MKKLKKYIGESNFITIFENGIHLIKDGYYILRGDKGSMINGDEKKSDGILIKINSDYYLFEMNEDFRGSNVLHDNLMKYNRINLKHISKKEYDNYSMSK